MSTAAATTATATSTRTSWRIDPAHSLVEFAVRHMMISTVRGRFAGVKGTVVIHGDHPGTAQVEVEIDSHSIDTREPQRDAHLKSADFFDAEQYTTITFNSRGATDVQGDRFKLVGDLTVHGVTREVILDVTSGGRGKDPWGGERAGYSATTKINRSDFGLTWNQALETGGILVGDEIRISLDLELVKL
jgi:polyisoprenoid-binding protein YceI